MSMHHFLRSGRMEPKRLAAIWLLLLSALKALPCQSQETAGSASPSLLPAAASTAVDALHRYHLPQSNNHSIYFKPGSAELGESARHAITDIAVRLNALPQLALTLVAYSDESEDASYGPSLRKDRVEAIIDALQGLSISSHRIHRIVTTTDHNSEQTSTSCTSEYCRQSYRRVRLELSRTLGD